MLAQKQDAPLPMMALGSFTPQQAKIAARFVKDRVVHDLGSGELGGAMMLAELGAKRVVAVDKIYKDGGRDCLTWDATTRLPGALEIVGAYFEEYDDTEPEIDVAFVSWPLSQGVEGLARLASRAKTVMYLGTNFNGTRCGSPSFWRCVTTRNVLWHAFDEWNSLIVYGEDRVRRALMPDEIAATNDTDVFYTGKYFNLFGDRG